jgi:hypothetical protein
MRTVPARVTSPKLTLLMNSAFHDGEGHERAGHPVSNVRTATAVNIGRRTIIRTA